MRATRRLGEISAALDKSKGGRPQENSSSAATSYSTKTATLAEFGLTRDQANKAEKIAAIPEAAFEAKIAETKAACKPPSPKAAAA